MVHPTYAGLPRQAALREFEALAPCVRQTLALQPECVAFGPDHAAVGIAIHGAETAAYHVTRIAAFYGAQGDSPGPLRPGR